MSINRWMDKEDGILLSCKKEWNNIICSNMAGPRDCHTEWSKSEKDKDKYDIVYMWNLKKNGSNELIYKKKSHRCRKLTVTRGNGGEREIGSFGLTYSTTTIYKVDS